MAWQSISFVFHSVSFGFGSVFYRVSTSFVASSFHSIGFLFASSFYVVSSLLHVVFFLAVARSERERNSGQGEEQYFFHDQGNVRDGNSVGGNRPAFTVNRSFISCCEKGNPTVTYFFIFFLPPAKMLPEGHKKRPLPLLETAFLRSAE